MSDENSKKNISASTINIDEIEKFTKIADQWWDKNGKFKPLHRINQIRIEYILDSIKLYLQKKDITNLNIIDIGCGGGLTAEPLARLGANVTGIDAGKDNIKVAKMHAEQSNLNINYIHGDIENLPDNNEKYDVVLVLEIIEHVDNPEIFIKLCQKVMRQGGIIIISTINRTIKSYFGAIVAAEYILKWLPKNTHEWKRFFKPAEIIDMFNEKDLNIKEIQGLKYNILRDNWSMDKDISINYFIIAQSN